MTSHRIAVIPGDGIGREVVPAGLEALCATADRFGIGLTFDTFDFASAAYWQRHGTMLPAGWEQTLRGYDAIYFGAVGWPEVVPDHISLWGSLLQFRRVFDQYVNLRPCRLMPGVRSPLAGREPGDIDFVVVRENTEGEYSSVGGRIFEGTERETVLQETVMTRVGVDRVLRFAFELASRRPRQAADLGHQEQRHLHLHAVLGRTRGGHGRAVPRRPRRQVPHRRARRPSSCCIPTGSTWWWRATCSATSCPTSARPAPARSASPRARTSTRSAIIPSLFEPVHGSAPDIAGKGIANPIGQIWCGSMMLEHLGHPEAAAQLLGAIEDILALGPAGRR